MWQFSRSIKVLEYAITSPSYRPSYFLTTERKDYMKVFYTWLIEHNTSMEMGREQLTFINRIGELEAVIKILCHSRNYITVELEINSPTKIRDAVHGVTTDRTDLIIMIMDARTKSGLIGACKEFCMYEKVRIR